ncbi:MAG TPA: PAS domain S-box protein [Fimbriimonadaceae bacterium]|nr:PAS domain S-box protein [Fimbriimonadaceae bacterium]
MSREIAHTLSPREAAILKLASEGYTDAAIAHRLEISEGTVGTYWGRIRTKLGPFSRPELVAIAIRTELAKQIEELEEQRDKLKADLDRSIASGQFYEGILDATDEGVLVIDVTGTIRHANPAALAVFGYTKEEMRGRPLSDLLPERFRVIHRQHIREFAANPANRRMNEHSDTVGLTKSGKEISLYVVISAIQPDGETFLTGFIRPGFD